MKEIYTIDQSEGTRRYVKHYIQCDTEEEYNEILAQRRKDREDFNWNNSIPDPVFKDNIICRAAYIDAEGCEIRAREYYWAHNWCGRRFDADGFRYTENYFMPESGHEEWNYCRPGSVRNESRPLTYDAWRDMTFGNS